MGAMQITPRSALLAAQSFASAQPAQPMRPANIPRRIDAFDLTDLAAKPDAAVKASAQNRTSPTFEAQMSAPGASINTPARDQRLIRPGSTLDIKV
jgi:hypothetical protein